MRGPTLVALALLVPLSGCVGNLPGVTTDGHLTFFQFEPIERGDAAPVAVADCAELQATLADRAEKQALVALDQSVAQQQSYYAVGAMEEDSVMARAPPAPSAAAPSPQSGSAASAQVTGTNNQESGVDEADIVKTDGEWTYVLHGADLRILHSKDVGDVAAYGSMSLGQPQGWGGGGGTLLLEPRDPGNTADDRLVAVLPGQDAAADPRSTLKESLPMQPTSGYTRIVVLSLADRKAPAVVHDEWVEGDAAGARLVAGTAYVVVHRGAKDLGLRTSAWPTELDLAARGLDWPTYQALDAEGQKAVRQEVATEAAAQNKQALRTADLGAQMPAHLHREYGLLVPDVPDDACQGIYTTPDATGRGFSTIVSLGVADPSIPTQSVAVMGGDPIVYAAQDAIVLAAPSQDFWWYWAQPDLEEATDLQWFRLDGLDVVPWASGRVPGIVEDSFDLDVHADTLRVVSATGTYHRGWLPEAALQTAVTVFDAAAGILVPRGTVAGIAPGERLWSVRFTDERAYIVTFNGMDPLFVVDLTGLVPELLGEVKVAGVSTYIHPIGEDRLLTIGYGGGDGGQGLDEGRVLVSLFDVRKPDAPRQLDVLDLGSGTSSGALHEHKAFTYWDAIGTLAIPTQSFGYVRDGDTGPHIGLTLVEVDAGKGTLALRGVVTQSSIMRQDTWGGGVERSYFLGDPGGAVSVYAVSPAGVTAHDLETLRLQGSVAFAPAG